MGHLEYDCIHNCLITTNTQTLLLPRNVVTLEYTVPRQPRTIEEKQVILKVCHIMMNM